MTEATEGTGGSGRDPDGELDGATAAELVASLADAVVIADVEGRIVVWNDSAVELFGWPAADALGQSLDLIIPERWRERHWAGYERVMATGTSKYGTDLLRVAAVHRSGRQLSIAFTVTVVRDADRAIGMAAVIRDETERRAELQRLRAALAERDG